MKKIDKKYDSATVLTEKELNKAIKALKNNLDEDSVEEISNVYFTHIYLINGFLPGRTRKHACLRFGYWCWKDVFEHPKDVLLYIKYKLK